MICLPLVVCAGAAVALSSSLPNVYTAQTTILLIPQRVPENYVRSTVTNRIEERLRTISQQIMSRTRLEALIKEFNLYPELTSTMLMEQVVAQMRPNVAIVPIRDESFQLSFSYTDPVLAAKVAERLATAFIDENLRDRELQADSTSRFLKAQLDDAGRRLKEHEKRLQDYRMAHSGSLPTQVASNLQMMQNAQQSLTMLSDASNRQRDRRSLIDAQVAEQERLVRTAAATPAPAAPAGTAATAPVAGTLEQQLQAARQNLDALQLRLAAGHPDVRRAQRQVTDLEAQVKAAPAVDPNVQPAVSLANPVAVAAQNRLRDLQSERLALDRQLAANVSEDKRLRSLIATYEARLEELPMRESELTELTRDYSTLQRTYQDLLSKHEDSVVAANLERRQIGEQFRVIDAARVPKLPVSPNRLLINGVGAVLGLLFGFGTAILLEVFNTTVRTDQEVGAALGIATLAMVPLLLTDEERNRQRRRSRLEFATVTLAALLAAGAAVWFKLSGGS